MQRVLGLAGLGVGIGTLGVLVWRPPRRLLGRLEARPLLGGAAVGAGISLLLVVMGLPIRAWMRQRSLDVGLSTQAWPDWAVDVVKGAGIGAVTAAIGGLVAVALVRRFPRNWWAPGAVLVIAYGVDDHLALSDRDRPGLQQVRQAAARPAAQRRARGWRTAPGWTWGRSTASTRAAGPAPRTRT